MAPYTDLVRTLPAAKFQELFAAQGRQGRDALVRRHQLRTPVDRGLPRAGARQQAQAALLRGRLAEVDDEEACQQLIRAWLLTRRSLLAAALDHLEIGHELGLTDSDEVHRIADLDHRQRSELVAALRAHGDEQDIAVYLGFMAAEAAAARAAR